MLGIQFKNNSLKLDKVSKLILSCNILKIPSMAFIYKMELAIMTEMLYTNCDLLLKFIMHYKRLK
jgi:hypothetical protein